LDIKVNKVWKFPNNENTWNVSILQIGIHNSKVKRDKPTRCNCSDVYYQTSISTCFRHHYAHYDPAPHDHSQHNQCRTPYAIIHSLVLLMMGIMMP